MTWCRQDYKCQRAHKHRGRGCPLHFNIFKLPTFFHDKQKTTGLLLSHLGSPRQHLYTTRSINTNTHTAGFGHFLSCLRSRITSSVHTINTPFIICVNQSEGIRQQRTRSLPGNPLSVQNPYPVLKECAQTEGCGAGTDEEELFVMCGFLSWSCQSLFPSFFFYYPSCFF